MDVTGAGAPPDDRGGDEVVCSAKGCRNAALWALRWRNPTIHAGGREKTWVACDDHRDTLGEFLARRDFLLRTEPLETDG